MKIKIKNGQVLAHSLFMPVIIYYWVGFFVVLAPVIIVLMIMTLLGYPYPEGATGLARIGSATLLLIYWVILSLSPAIMAGGFVALGVAILKMRGKKFEIESLND